MQQEVLNMKRKHYLARKIALTDSEARVYVFGWDDALQMASDLARELGQHNLSLLIKAIGSAEVDKNGKVIRED